MYWPFIDVGELANVRGTAFQLALPDKQTEAVLKKGNLVEMHNADKSEKYFVATDPYYKDHDGL
jgi:hypothetical protein